ncbi:biopolymer transporter ExbD [Bacteroidia bacterium]|nr:biopolymer transporter ExbD [Bacteroidia bacterium]
MTDRRKIPEINAGSMADIAFLLLIFFLVATTMKSTETGLNRTLPPLADPARPQQQLRIKERNLMLVFVNRFDQIMVGREAVDISQLAERTEEFILNSNDDPHLPEKEQTQIEFLGIYPVSRGIVSLQSDRGTSYDCYVRVQNELTRAFNEIRDRVAMERFGRRFTELNADRRDAVQRAVPMKISEAEPRNTEAR